jgi:hypothetical protein
MKAERTLHDMTRRHRRKSMVGARRDVPDVDKRGCAGRRGDPLGRPSLCEIPRGRRGDPMWSPIFICIANSQILEILSRFSRRVLLKSSFVIGL